ncbi:MAG: DUF222 domain-containing protein [Geodermatophilaceae bacterium]|nr:DUF222 domain-containing protein [Geodermatophilaceae bacterium]
MFDSVILDRVFDRFEAMARDGERHAAAFGDLPELPGPDLAGALDMWEPGTRADDELIDRIGAWEKLRAWADAGQMADIAELVARRRAADELERADHAARSGHGEPGHLIEFVVDEIALAARLSRVAAAHRLDLAADLTRALPEVFTALQSGDLDLGRARIITDGTRGLEADARVAVAGRVLAKAPGQTHSALRAAVARAVHISTPSAPKSGTSETWPIARSP